MGRAPCCDKANVKKGPWSPEEDTKLKEYIEKFGTGGNWIALPQKAGLKRCGKSCRLRWLNYLRPNIKHGEFSDDEDRIICTLYATMGSRWSIIASQLPGRTDNDIKNYWNTKLKKKLMGGLSSHYINNYGKFQQQVVSPFPLSSATTTSFQTPLLIPTQSHHQPLANLYNSYFSNKSVLPALPQQNHPYGNSNIDFYSSSIQDPYHYDNGQQKQEEGLVDLQYLVRDDINNNNNNNNNMLVFGGGNETSCSSSADGIININKNYVVKQEQQMDHHQCLARDDHGGRFMSNGYENQRFMLHFSNGDQFSDQKSATTTHQLQYCDLEHVKQLVSSHSLLLSNNNDDENKTHEKDIMYYY